ncbi:hypothetical protein PJI17_30080 [Mycobacterium kansasii]
MPARPAALDPRPAAGLHHRRSQQPSLALDPRSGKQPCTPACSTGPV